MNLACSGIRDPPLCLEPRVHYILVGVQGRREWMPNPRTWRSHRCLQLPYYVFYILLERVRCRGEVHSRTDLIGTSSTSEHWRSSSKVEPHRISVSVFAYAITPHWHQSFRPKPTSALTQEVSSARSWDVLGKLLRFWSFRRIPASIPDGGTPYALWSARVWLHGFSIYTDTHFHGRFNVDGGEADEKHRSVHDTMRQFISYKICLWEANYLQRVYIDARSVRRDDNE